MSLPSPKVQNASDLMMNCPDVVDEKQLDDLSIAVTRWRKNLPKRNNGGGCLPTIPRVLNRRLERNQADTTRSLCVPAFFYIFLWSLDGV